jgi:hypothetical protein
MNMAQMVFLKHQNKTITMGYGKVPHLILTY